MSEPQDQGLGNPGCERYASVHCVEGLFNYYYGLGSNKVRLNANASCIQVGEASADKVFEQWMSTALEKKVNTMTGSPNTFPNYNNAYYDIKGKVKITANIKATIEAVLPNTPVVIKLNGTPSDYSPGDPPIDPPTGEAHLVVVVDYGTENNIDYFECMNSFGPDWDGDDSGFFKIKSANIDSWCTEAVYPYIHTDTTSWARSNLDLNCAPKIVPYFMYKINPVLYDNKITESILGDNKHDDEDIYIYGGDVRITGYLDLFHVTNFNDVIYVDTTYDSSIANAGGYYGINEIVVDGGTFTTDAGTKITKIGPSQQWGSIYVTSHDNSELIFASNTQIEYARKGLIVYGNGSGDIIQFPADPSSSVKFRQCGTSYGASVELNDCTSGTIFQNVRFEDTVSSTQESAITVFGASSYPRIKNVTFNNNAYYGLSLNNPADAYVEKCDFGVDNSSQGTYRIKLNSYCIVDGSGLHNNIYPTSASYRIDNDYAGAMALMNQTYWGLNPDWTTFFTSVNRAIYSIATSEWTDAGAASKRALSTDPLVQAREYEQSGMTDMAIASYHGIVRDSDNEYYKKLSLKSLLGLYAITGTDYYDLRDMLQQEIDSQSIFCHVYDYLYCETFVQEAERMKEIADKAFCYQQALRLYEDRISKYSGTSMEVEMLSRCAIISGHMLNDKEKALYYANRAKD